MKEILQKSSEEMAQDTGAGRRVGVLEGIVATAMILLVLRRQQQQHGMRLGDSGDG